jgi:DNA-binding response OmpR family regulator
VAEQEIDPEEKPSAGRILLCADDPNAGIGVRAGLRRFGFATDFAHDRAAALARAAAAPYGAIVADLELPDGESIGLVRDLRNQPRNARTPIIGLTADPAHDPAAPAGSQPDDWVVKPMDVERLAQILNRSMARDARERPHILHVDDDPDALDVVARALGTSAEVTSVGSLADARRALAAHDFDLAVLDIELGPVSGLDLLPELRGGTGHVIPVIIFSARGTSLMGDRQVQASLSKSRDALDSLVTAVHARLRLGSARASKESV